MFVKTAQGWRQIAGTSEYSPPAGVRGLSTAGTSVPASAWTPLAFQAEDYDTNSFHDNVTNNTRFTVPAGQGGRYALHATAIAMTTAAGQVEIGLRKNGSTFLIIERFASNLATQGLGTSTVVNLNPGDYVEVCIYQTTAGAITFGNASGHNQNFSMTRIDGVSAVADGVGQSKGFRVYKAAGTQSLAAGTLTKIVFDTKLRDDANAYDLTTNVWAVPETGWYHVAARVTFNTSGDGERFLAPRIVVNGNVAADGQDINTGAAGQVGLSGDTVLYLTKGDAVEIQALRGLAGPVTFGIHAVFFAAVFLEPQAHAHTNFDSITTKSVSAGLEGATAPTRYAGGTVSGAPTTGTFMVGDYVVAQDGTIWICSVAGTPGTWIQVSGGLKGVGLSTVYSGGPPDNALGAEGDFWIPDSANNTPPSISNGWLIPDGTVAAPSIAFLSNPDTGFYQDTDGIHYSKEAADRGIILTGSGSKVTVGLQAPTTPAPGDLWVDTNGTEQGLLVTSNTPRLTVALTAPTTPAAGDLWVAAPGA